MDKNKYISDKISELIGEGKPQVEAMNLAYDLWNKEQPLEMFQKGGTKPPIYVESKNDPRYKSYNDSLSLYNNYSNNRNTIVGGNKYYPTVETKKPIKTTTTEKAKLPNPNNPLELKKVSPDFSYSRIKDSGLPEITYLSNKRIQPIAQETFTRKESKFKSEKEYDKASKTLSSFFDAPNKINWVGYDIAKYKEPNQPVLLQDLLVEPPLREPPQVTALKQMLPQGIVPQTNQISAPLPVFNMPAQIPTSFNIQEQDIRMNDGRGYYDGMNTTTDNIDVAVRAKAQSDAYNAEIERKYNNPQAQQNLKAQERYNTLKNDVTVTPQYQNGGTVEEDKKWIENWYQNRIIPNEELQNIYLEDKPYYLERSDTIPNPEIVDKISDNTTGQTQYDTGKILLTKEAQPTVYTHEANHWVNGFPSAMRTVHGNITKENIAPIEGVGEGYKDKYDYFSNPDEVHSRIQVLRKEAGIKPDQKVTPEFLQNFIKNYKGNNENINDLLNLSDQPHLLEMLNYMADNTKSKPLPIAQNGGTINYNEKELKFLEFLKNK